MKTITVSMAEGKKEFSRLVNEASKNNEDIVITKRGKPMAVIIPYSEYLQTRKIEAQQKILRLRAAFSETGLSSEELLDESRRELEHK